MSGLDIKEDELTSALENGYTGIENLAKRIIKCNPTTIRMSNQGALRIWDSTGNPIFELKPQCKKALRAAAAVTLYIGRFTDGKILTRTPPKLIGYDCAHLSHIEKHLDTNHPDYKLVREIFQYAGALQKIKGTEDFSYSDEDLASEIAEEPCSAPPQIELLPDIVPEENDLSVDGAYTLEEILVSSNETKNVRADGLIEYVKSDIKEQKLTYLPEITEKSAWKGTSRVVLVRKD